MTVFESPFGSVPVPDVALTPFVFERARALGDKPAFVDAPTGRALTFRQTDDMVRAVAAGLAARGFGKGDVLGLLLPNLPEYPVAFHAAALLGGIATTVNPLYTADELAHQLSDAGAKFLLTIPQFVATASEAAGRSTVKEVFVLGEAEGATPFASLLEPDGSVPEVDIDPREDVVVLPYSSGTTGLSKGVMLTHHNIVANLLQIAAALTVGEDDVVIGVLPFFHIYGQTVIMNASFRAGATTVTMPRFDLEQFCRVIQDHRVTWAFLVPPIVLALAKHPVIDAYDLSSLRVVFCGAAPLSGDLAEAAATRIGCQVRQGYGLTETSPVTHSIGRSNKPGSIGPLLPDTEGKVMDTADGRELGPDADGEIWVRGPQVMKGYLNNPEATASTIDAEGWLHTGDIGHADDDGYFYVVDRVKELIKYKGLQVPPAELEAVLVRHPSVADAAVIPVPDEEAGEVPKAFVVLRQGAEATPDEIMAYVAKHVAPHKKVRRLEFVDEIPKSLSGKILRRVLVDRERELARQGDAAPA
ncbi:MAG TPA: 4-coumarate--CoA ligase family protein [Actinomycetota bacterium]|jgi:acyl-CoA synthetase (AMP-forming)/AMP-acid ligase II